MNIIKLSNVSKSFKDICIFENLDIEFNQGEIHGIIGPNGCGKSVLFKLICGFMLPDKGNIYIDGVELNRDNRFPTNFGAIIDRPGYIDDISGFDNLKHLASIQNKIDDQKIEATMNLLGLNPKSETKVKNYSLGMKQKLAICQAIMEDQSVLILDEPFNALDFDSVGKVRHLLKDFKQEGKTILLTSHNKEDIDAVCDKVYRINNYNIDIMN
ncbi:MAG: ATP-binding cassette domain-containing protein [Epulopiscium sp.]|nr:ATP-binding cassette domain-containing protein [Candidatus Epulonipiscium sp.]